MRKGLKRYDIAAFIVAMVGLVFGIVGYIKNIDAFMLITIVSIILFITIEFIKEG